MRKGLKDWSKSLGIAFSNITGKEETDEPYTETMHRFELWLRDELGYIQGELINDYDTLSQLRKDFFDEFIEKEPDLFSSQKIKIIDYEKHQVYVCTGCQSQMTPNVLDQCCALKRKKKKSK